MDEETVITQETLGTLYPAEVELIHLLRTKYRWGLVEIEVKDGMPIFIKRTEIREKLA